FPPALATQGTLTGDTYASPENVAAGDRLCGTADARGPCLADSAVAASGERWRGCHHRGVARVHRDRVAGDRLPALPAEAFRWRHAVRLDGDGLHPGSGAPADLRPVILALDC